MLRRFLLCLLVVFVPVQSWAVIDMGIQHQQKTLQIPQMIEDNTAHSCHQNGASATENPHSSHQASDNSGCNSCTLCMAIGFLQAPQALDLSDSFSQSFHSINQPLIGVDISDLTKPPIR